MNCSFGLEKAKNVLDPFEYLRNLSLIILVFLVLHALNVEPEALSIVFFFLKQLHHEMVEFALFPMFQKLVDIIILKRLA